jgi:hypothetical protein
MQQAVVDLFAILQESKALPVHPGTVGAAPSSSATMLPHCWHYVWVDPLTYHHIVHHITCLTPCTCAVAVHPSSSPITLREMVALFWHLYVAPLCHLPHPTTAPLQAPQVMVLAALIPSLLQLRAAIAKAFLCSRVVPHIPSCHKTRTLGCTDANRESGCTPAPLTTLSQCCHVRYGAFPHWPTRCATHPHGQRAVAIAPPF